MQKTSEYDNRTGLLNRRELIRTLNGMQPWPGPSTGFAAHLIEIHCLHLINTRYGQECGDAVLLETAHRLRHLTDKDDIVARFGGDEFMVIRFDQNSLSSGKDFAADLRGLFSAPMNFNGKAIDVALHVGTIEQAERCRTTQVLVEAIEAAIKKEKAEMHGDCRSHIMHSSLASAADETTAREMRAGITDNQFLLHYQPILTAKTRQIEGYEALLRWSTPTRGLVSPAEFVPAAERTGLITDLCAWVLSEGCREIAQRSDTLGIAINVSSISLAKGSVASEIAAALRTTGLQPHRLTMEITESIYLNLTNSVAWQLDQISDMGVRIAIDDFGTGYSSLSYIGAIPINCIKIDQSFVKTIAIDRKAKVIVKAILEIADGLGLKTVAEGIETEEEAGIVCDMGVSAVQGYLFGRPLPARAIFGDDASAQSGARA